MTDRSGGWGGVYTFRLKNIGEYRFSGEPFLSVSRLRPPISSGTLPAARLVRRSPSEIPEIPLVSFVQDRPPVFNVGDLPAAGKHVPAIPVLIAEVVPGNEVPADLRGMDQVLR